VIWRSQRNKRFAQIADFITVVIGFIIGFLLWELIIKEDFQYFILRRYYIYQLIISASLFIYLLSKNGAYSYQRFTSLLTEFSNILKASYISFLILITLAFLVSEKEIPRSLVVIIFVVITLLLIIEKTFVYQLAAQLRRRGLDRKRIILVGTGTRAREFIEKVDKNFSWGLDIIGLITGDKEKVGTNLLGVKILEHYDNFERIVKTINPEEVIITISTKRFDQIRKLLDTCESAGISVRLNSDFFGQLTKKYVTIDNVFGLNIISFNFTNQNELQKFMKRLMDIVVSSITLVLLIPLFTIVSILILLQDGSPIFYRWQIVGYNRKPIKSWKFRTMVRNADRLKTTLADQNEMQGPVFKIKNDPRILPIGRFLRKFSIDELPQLISVLKGDLSLVGPRPPLQYEFENFEIWHRRKLSVKPGLTCLWQISGRSNITNFNEWVKLDLQYIDNWSLLLDINILIKTIPVVLWGKGAK